MSRTIGAADQGEGAGRQLGDGQRLVAFVAALGLVFGAALVVGSVVGDGGDDAASEGVTVKGLRDSEDGYRLDVLTTQLGAQVPQEFRFLVAGPDGTPVASYRDRHERPLHLILVSRDLTVFRHVHPTLRGDGVWAIELEPLASGPYRVYADFAPVGGPELTLGRDVMVEGEHRPAPLPAAGSTAVVDGYQLDLTGAPRAGGEGQVTLTVRRDGRPVGDLEPYLGALGHLVAIRGSDLAYLHVHPLDGRAGPGEVPFVVEAPSTGIYRLFFDFSHAGTVRTAAFTVEVSSARNGPPTTAVHGGH